MKTIVIIMIILQPFLTLLVGLISYKMGYNDGKDDAQKEHELIERKEDKQ